MIRRGTLNIAHRAPMSARLGAAGPRPGKAFNRAGEPHARRGVVLIYSLILMTILLALVSLAVDYGHMQLVKAQLQRAADASARGTLQEYASSGAATALNYGYWLNSNNYNPVDTAYTQALANGSYVPNNTGSNPRPTVTTIWGWWDTTNKSFVPGSGTPLAVQVTFSRTAQNGNAVPLTFPLMSGWSSVTTSCDISARAVAVLTAGVTSNQTVLGKADVWLSGMPAGSNASWSDSPANAPPVLAMSVTPGTTLTFNATGLTSYSGPSGVFGAGGASYSTTHMQGSPDGNYNGLQNGIQTLTAPQNALIGVFLTDAQPSTQVPPSSGLNQSSASARDATSYTSLKNQQPFYIGSGQNTSGTTQSFVVPAGATRLYLGVFDGWQNNDNPGQLAVILSQKPKVTLVK